MREEASELQSGEAAILHIRQMTQYLKDNGHSKVLPEHIRRMIRSIVEDGRSGRNQTGSISIINRGSEHLHITLHRNSWSSLSKTAERRRMAAQQLLSHLIACVPEGTKGKDILVETTLGKLEQSLKEDMQLSTVIKDYSQILERSLMWLHEQEIIRLNKGFIVFRPAMSIKLNPKAEKRRFSNNDFNPLKTHYESQIFQIHVMDSYAQQGMESMDKAVDLTLDYFELEQQTFINRWLPNRKEELLRQITPISWQKIVDALGDTNQKAIVSYDPEQQNLLVLAGPGSGKTKVLVHRIAYLIRVKREKPESIIALTYNHHASLEIRKRLKELIGNDSFGVSVMTCHSLAIKLVGVSFAKSNLGIQPDAFKKVLIDAVSLLNGEGLLPEEADQQRDRLLAGFRHNLVDEYQDIDNLQYELISALSGRTQQDDEGKNTIFAVGDDDQNIYAFNGSSVEFIHRFETDYAATTQFLIENYRSTAHIINAANMVIAPGCNRMKSGHPIEINQARKNLPQGGDWARKDPVSQGRVQLIKLINTPQPEFVQLSALMQEFLRLKKLDNKWEWYNCAIIAREWRFLDPVRSWCELNHIPIQLAHEDSNGILTLRETQQFINWIKDNAKANNSLKTDQLHNWLRSQISNPWWELLEEAINAYSLEYPESDLSVPQLVDWLIEWGREARRKQTGLLLLTAHRAKGLEFDHVGILDGGWQTDNVSTDLDETRRLFYVAMTRAKQNLIIMQAEKIHCFEASLRGIADVFEQEVTIPTVEAELDKRYIIPSLSDIDLGYAGRTNISKDIHHAIAALSYGDSLRLIQEGTIWYLLDKENNRVGKMAKGFMPPKEKICIHAKVLRVHKRSINMVPSPFTEQFKYDVWEVVVPELIFR